MKQNAEGTKEAMCLYLSTDVVETIRTEAVKQHRKLSAQAEIFLTAGIKGEKLDKHSEILQTCGAYDRSNS